MFFVTRKWVCDKCGVKVEVTREVAELTKDAPMVLPDGWSIYIDKESVRLKCEDCNKLTHQD
jgi:hypothetical protein